ncbi:hypothetical protein APF79_03430 [bacterium BRH_c32]|nr:MAG: hypothetical protein APF79_03430 [bacterium BRH_c32]
MIKNDEMDRLLRYLANQSSYEEMRNVQLWLEKDPKNRSQFEELKKIWLLTPDNLNWNTDSEWANFKNKIEAQQEISNESAPQSAAEKSINSSYIPEYRPSLLESLSFYFRRYSFALTIVLIALIAGYAGYNYFNSPVGNSSDSIIWNEKITLAGEKAEILLPDNSKVILNSESKLRYPNSFSGNSRDIYLTGEAYFEVRNSNDRKFNVHSAGFSTTVLGTKFNVSAFHDEEIISVSLLEGKVKITPENENSNDTKNARSSTILSPNQQWVYNYNNKRSEINSFNHEKAIGWKDNIIVFENTPLIDVFKKLERIYGVEFRSEGNFKNKNITTKFNGDSIWLVAEVIKKTTGLNYKTITKNNLPGTFIFY